MEYGTSKNEKKMLLGPCLEFWVLVNMHDIIESEGVQKQKSSSPTNLYKYLHTDRHTSNI